MQSKPRVVKKILRHYCTLHAEQIQGCQKDPETLDCATMQATLGIISVLSSFFKLSHKHSEQLMFFSELNLGKSCSLTKTLHKHCLCWKNNVTSHDNWTDPKYCIHSMQVTDSYNEISVVQFHHWQYMYM